MGSTVLHAIHLVPTDAASGLVKQLAVPRAQIRILSERLTIGPCDIDPDRHVALRRAWNAEEARETVGLEDLRAAIAGDLPIVVWATRAFVDLVWLWWVLDGLTRLDALARPVLVARPLLEDPLAPTGAATPDQGQLALGAARALRDDELRESAELWSRYVAPAPLAFDQARRAGSRTFPELGETGELHGAWFPRLADNQLRLSELDELLLGQLGDDRRTPRELIADMPGRERLLWPFGAFAPVLRLRAWAARGAIAREVRSHDSFLEQDAFQLTDRTRELLARGLDSVADAPVFYIGGCRLYDPDAPWVRIADAAGWRLARA